MALILSEEQTFLKESARDFFKSMAPISRLRELRDNGDPRGYSAQAWKQMTGMGWAGLLIPEAFGGMSFDYQGMGQIFEESGRTLSASPLLSTAVISAYMLTHLGNDSQKQEYLTKIANGEIIVSPAIEESIQFDLKEVKCNGIKKGSGISISGSKICVLDGQAADYLLVSFRMAGSDTGSASIQLAIIPSDATGLHIASITLMDSRKYANVSLNNVKIDQSQLLTSQEGTYKTIAKSIDIANTLLSAELLGISMEAFERTLSYLKERKQFDTIIGTFQALQHRAANMFCEIEICKSLVIKALQGIDEDSMMLPGLASMAKAKCSRTAQNITNEAVQMHGGIGMTDDEEIGFFLKRSRVAMQQYGNYNYHLDRFAKLSGY